MENLAMYASVKSTSDGLGHVHTWDDEVMVDVRKFQGFIRIFNGWEHAHAGIDHVQAQAPTVSALQ